MRLINGDTLLKRMNELCDLNCPYSITQRDVMCSACLMGDAIDAVDNAPTVDAVPVVRCKDCKHYQFADNRAFGFPVKQCEWTGFEDVDDDDFCSRGERRKQDDNT